MIDKHPRARKLVLFLLVFFVVWTIRGSVFYAVDLSIESEMTRAWFSTFVKLLLWVVPAIAFSRWTRSDRRIAYLGFSTRPSLRTWRTCLVVTATFPAAGKQSVELFLPVWSPGFYRVENYHEQLTDFVARHNGNIDSLVKSVVDDVDAYVAGRPQGDDICLVGFQRLS